MQNSTFSEDDLQPGEGMVIETNGQKTAVYKTVSGEVIRLSAKCTHLQCIVGWNNSDKTWDCPCHGSRFSKDGKVINGPATTDLPLQT